MDAEELYGVARSHRHSVSKLSLRDVRRAGSIASGYTTNRVFVLDRAMTDKELVWTLREASLPHAFTKIYDSGDPREWLQSYPDAGSPDDFNFYGCRSSGLILGLLTWRSVDWNEVISLIDIRVRESHRRQGLGTLLVEALQSECRRSHMRGITVETQTSNLPAVRFYLKHGFSVCGFHEYLYTNNDMERNDVALFLYWSS